MMRTSTIVGLLILVCLPLRASAQVITWDTDDDGVIDPEDNCPYTYNPDQIDSDAVRYCPPKGECSWVFDDKGDVCDPCPTSQDDADCDEFFLSIFPPVPTATGPVTVQGAYVAPVTTPHIVLWVNGVTVRECDALLCEGTVGPFADTFVVMATYSKEDGTEEDSGELFGGGALKDMDQDGIWDPSDNCRAEPNFDQADTDEDGSGDACDNCPDVPNSGQEDANGNGVGDLCDCDDGLRGPDEFGVDCGGICPDPCGDPCVPLLVNGSSVGRVDIVVIAADEEHDSLDDFVQDALDALQDGLLSVREVENHPEKFNVWFYDDSEDRAPFEYQEVTVRGTTSVRCSWEEPAHWLEACPQADMGVVLHEDQCRDYARLSGVFSSEVFNPGTIVHEAGHALFGLADEYDDGPDCWTHYFQPDPFPNIYEWTTECEELSENPDDCFVFTGCQDIWSKAVHDDWIITTIMESCSNNDPDICFWGADATQRVQHVLDQYEPMPDTGYTRIATTRVAVGPTSVYLVDAVVNWGTPSDNVAVSGDFQVSWVDTAGLITSITAIGSPHTRLYEPGTPPEDLDTATFALTFPVEENLRMLLVKDATGQLPPAALDLAPAILDYCAAHLAYDPMCTTSDLDADGVPDTDDNCPVDPNPSQGDADDDGQGDTCTPPDGLLGLLEEEVRALPDAAFDSKPDKRRAQLLHRLEVVGHHVRKGGVQAAAAQLRNGFARKADGCLGGVVEDDWVVDCDAQVRIAALLEPLLAALEAG